MGRLSRNKGQVWEREVAKIFREALGLVEIRRGLQSQGGGAFVADVDGVPGLHLECKHGKSISWRKAMRQAERDVAARGVEGMVPVIVVRDHGNPDPSPFVGIPGDGFTKIARQAQPCAWCLVYRLGKRPNARQALMQAIRQAPDESTPCAIVDLPGGVSYAFLRLDDFVDLYARYLRMRPERMDAEA